MSSINGVDDLEVTDIIVRIQALDSAGIDGDRLGESMVLEHREDLSDIVSRYLDFTQIEFYDLLKDTEDAIVDRIDEDVPEWSLRLIAQELTIESMLEEIDKITEG